MKGMIRAAAMAFLLASGVSWAEDYDAGLEAFNAGDYETAYETWRPMAEQGDAVAQNRLGIMYARGQGVAQDDAEAVRWYQAASAQAQRNNRICRETGYQDCGACIETNYQDCDWATGYDEILPRHWLETR